MTNGNDSACGVQTLGEKQQCGGKSMTEINLTQPLTKREVFATNALIGILCSQHNANYEHGDLFAKKAVRQADLLIAALNE